MCTFLENPQLELTNNAAECEVRPVVMGRKNWLFANTEAGAKAVAVIFSIIETAKANFLKPKNILTGFLTELGLWILKAFKNVFLGVKIYLKT